MTRRVVWVVERHPDDPAIGPPSEEGWAVYRALESETEAQWFAGYSRGVAIGRSEGGSYRVVPYEPKEQP